MKCCTRICTCAQRTWVEILAISLSIHQKNMVNERRTVCTKYAAHILCSNDNDDDAVNENDDDDDHCNFLVVWSLSPSMLVVRITSKSIRFFTTFRGLCNAKCAAR